MSQSLVQKFFYPATHNTPVSIALLLLRLVGGAAFILHGWGKIQNPFAWMGPDSGTPGILQALAAISEFGGGIAWVIGLLSSLASVGIASTMVVATHLHMVILEDPFVGKGGSYELSLLYLALSIAFILCGPGKFSADAKIFHPK